MPRDRWSLFWLAVAAVLSLFAAGRWIVPLAAWLGPVFWLRFIRTQPVIRGYLMAVAVGTVVAYLAYQGMVPLSPTDYAVSMVTGAVFSLLPFLADRLMAPRVKGFSSTLIFPLASTAIEYLSSLTQPFGTWGSTAYTQVDNLPLLQLASVTGIWGITFIMSWLAPVANWVWEQGVEWARVRAGVLLYAGLVGAVLLFGGARLVLAPPAENSVRVAGLTTASYDALWAEFRPVFVGGGQATDINWDSLLVKGRAVADDLFDQTQRAARAGAKIVFWAEAMALVMKEDEAALVERGRRLARQEQIYLGMTLATLLHRDPTLAPERKMIENKIVLIDPSGEVAWTYLKAIPVPGAEATLTAKGDGHVPLATTPFGRLAAAICFDMDFPDLPRQAGQGGADLMFVPSGDWREISPYHTYMAIFRAVENGLSLIRVVNNGLSAAVDYQGRVLAAMDYLSTQDRTMLAHVPTRGVGTIYSQIGDAFAWLSIAGFVAMLGWVVVRRRPV